MFFSTTTTKGPSQHTSQGYLAKPKEPIIDIVSLLDVVDRQATIAARAEETPFSQELSLDPVSIMLMSDRSSHLQRRESSCASLSYRT
jgi:hypothetical protein